MRAKPSTHLPILRGRSFAAVLVLALAAAGVSAHDDEKDSLRNADPAKLAAARAAVAREHPALMRSITRGGSFSSEFSQAIANNMYSRTDAAAIADARAKLQVESHGPRTWLLRLPFVNIAVFETDDGGCIEQVECNHQRQPGRKPASRGANQIFQERLAKPDPLHRIALRQPAADTPAQPDHHHGQQQRRQAGEQSVDLLQQASK